MYSRFIRIGLAVPLALALGGPVLAGIVVYEEGDKKLEVGGRIQIQYESVDPDCPSGVPCWINTSGDTSTSRVDDLVFRRLRPYVAGSVTEDWFGKIEFDFGEASDDNEVSVKDAYMTYTGLGKNLKLTFGNSKPLFSREFNTSSAKLQMVERSFVGDHNFGSPDRMLGVKLNGKNGAKKITYGASLGVASHDPDANKMDFDTPVNGKDDWNDGVLVSGRVDFHPMGVVKFEQADFARESFRVTAGVAAFHWNDDGDNDSYIDPLTGMSNSATKADLDKARGLEVSAAVRGRGFSADVAYHKVSGDTVDSTFTGGMYENGSTDLDIVAVTAGYLVVGDRLEVAAAWDSLDADGYADKFQRTTVGLNWYLNRHKLKLQTDYQIVSNFLGMKDQDQKVFRIMSQYVF